jgi:hypothetical protein
MKRINFMDLLENVTRVEVIDENGRSYVNKNNKMVVECSMQDDGKTLKIFISIPK